MNQESEGRDYVHGYSRRESRRLFDQARTLSDLLLSDTTYPPGTSVLEAGCGVGAQTITLAQQSPETQIVAVDISRDSLAEAKRKVNALALANVTFHCADIFALPFAPTSFDHIFVCFVLEHLREPAIALVRLREVLKPGGTITVIEGDHGSAYFHPNSHAAQQAVDCLVKLQALAGGDGLIGRQLYPLLVRSGFIAVRVSPRMVYVDGGRPDLIDGFTHKTFIAMVEGVRGAAIAQGLMDAAAFDSGVRDLYRAAAPDGVFCYTFFKGLGVR
jgi:SAM-dependent methyltransferase